MKGLSSNYAVFSTFSVEMYHCFVHNGCTPQEESLESIFKFSHLLIRGLIKGLSPHYAIFSTFSLEIHYCTW